jgi:small ligand-binding sensory domain FIST
VTRARFAAAVSEHPVAASAVGEVVGQVIESLAGPADLALLFVGQAHIGSIGAITAAVRDLLQPRTLLGSTTHTVVGGPQEIEGAPAIALWAASIGTCTPLRLEPWHGPEGWVVPGLPAPTDEPRTMILLGDPFTFDAEPVVDAMASAWPGLTVVGGLVSGVTGPGRGRLLLDGAVHTDAAVAVLLPPDLPVRAVVSQGTRPIGDPFVVTRRHDNVVVELGGKAAMARLDDLVATATPEERSLLARGLNLGIVIDERKEHFERGDFLVRAVLGAERGTGGIATASPVEVGTTAQFHVRDAVTADEDLRLALAGPPADAALLFTCTARGSNLFGVADHDATLVHEAVGRGAVAGMSSSAELGPVGGANFVHGYTASILLFGG